MPHRLLVAAVRGTAAASGCFACHGLQNGWRAPYLPVTPPPGRSLPRMGWQRAQLLRPPSCASHFLMCMALRAPARGQQHHLRRWPHGRRRRRGGVRRGRGRGGGGDAVGRPERGLLLEVPAAKLAATASQTPLARRIASATCNCNRKGRAVAAGKPRGTPSGGGRQRSMRRLAVRVRLFAKRACHIHASRRAGVRASQLASGRALRHICG